MPGMLEVRRLRRRQRRKAIASVSGGCTPAWGQVKRSGRGIVFVARILRMVRHTDMRVTSAVSTRPTRGWRLRHVLDSRLQLPVLGIVRVVCSVEAVVP